MIDIFDKALDNTKVKPIFPFAGTSPLPVEAGVGRQMIANFDQSGTSGHTLAGSTLWVILAHCTINDIPFQLMFQPTLGYEIKRIDRLYI